MCLHFYYVTVFSFHFDCKIIFLFYFYLILYFLKYFSLLQGQYSFSIQMYEGQCLFLQSKCVLSLTRVKTLFLFNVFNI